MAKKIITKKAPIIRCLYDELVPLSKLKPHPNNRNNHPPDQLERLAQIIEYQGWRYPIKVSKKSGLITSGHGRLLAAQMRGWGEAPVNYQEYDTKIQEYADVQADNAIALWAELDLVGVHADIRDIGKEFDLALLGLQNISFDIAMESSSLPTLSQVVQNEAKTFQFSLSVPKIHFELFDKVDKEKLVEHIIKHLRAGEPDKRKGKG